MVADNGQVYMHAVCMFHIIGQSLVESLVTIECVKEASIG